MAEAVDDGGVYLAEHLAWSEDERVTVTGSMLRASQLHELSDGLRTWTADRVDMTLQLFDGIDDALRYACGIELSDLQHVY